MTQQKTTLAEIIAFMRPLVIGMDAQLTEAAEFVLFHTRVYNGEKARPTNLKNFRLAGKPGTGKTNLAYAIASALCHFAGFEGWSHKLNSTGAGYEIEGKRRCEIAASATPAQVMTRVKEAIAFYGRTVLFLDESHLCPAATVGQLLKATNCGGTGEVNFRMPYGTKGEISYVHSAADVVYIFATDRELPSTALEERAKSGGKADIPMYSIEERKQLFAFFARRDGLTNLPTEKAVDFLLPFTRGTARSVEEMVSRLNALETPVRSVADAAKMLLEKRIYPGGLTEDHKSALVYLYDNRKRGVATKELASKLDKRTKTNDLDTSAVEKLLADADLVGENMFQWHNQGKALGDGGISYVEANFKKAKKPAANVVSTVTPSKALEIEAKIKALEAAK